MAKDFVDNIMEIVSEYYEEVDEDLDDALEAAGEAGVKAIKDAPIEGTGRYLRGWKSKLENEQFGEHEVVIYNDTQPSLTHLLEKGHQLFINGVDQGKKTRAIPHIAPGFDVAVDELNRRLGR